MKTPEDSKAPAVAVQPFVRPFMKDNGTAVLVDENGPRNPHQPIQLPERFPVERILFVWVKDGTLRCFGADEIKGKEEQLRIAGWQHTATIDPAKWIESLANGIIEPSDMLDDLQFSQTNSEI